MGGVFKDVLEVASQNLNSKIGLFANDHLAYSNYIELFYNSIKRIIKNVKAIDEFKFKETYVPKYINLKHEYMSGYKIKFHRNLSTFKFINSIQFDQERIAIHEILRAPLVTMDLISD